MGVTIFSQPLLWLIFDSYHYWHVVLHFYLFYFVFSLNSQNFLKNLPSVINFFLSTVSYHFFDEIIILFFFTPPLQSLVFIPNIFSSDCVDFFLIIQNFFVYYLRLFTRNWKERNLSYPIFMACIPLWLRDFRNSSTLKGMWRWVNV